MRQRFGFAFLFFLRLCSQSRRHRADSGLKTALCGGEGSYRGLGVEGGGAMLEGVWTVAVRGGGGGTLPHAADWLDGTGSRLERKQTTFLVNRSDPMSF